MDELTRLAEGLFRIERCAYCNLLILKDGVTLNGLPMHRVCADGNEDGQAHLFDGQGASDA